MKVEFRFRSETKNTYRYEEVDTAGVPIDDPEKYKIGPGLYIRKHAFPEGHPAIITVEITVG